MNLFPKMSKIRFLAIRRWLFFVAYLFYYYRLSPLLEYTIPTVVRKNSVLREMCGSNTSTLSKVRVMNIIN